MTRDAFKMTSYNASDDPLAANFIPTHDSLVLSEHPKDANYWIAIIYKMTAHDCYRKTTIVASSQTLAKSLATSILRDKGERK